MPTERILNVPNQLTIARLVLSIVCFVFLAFDCYLVALVLFVLAAGTDWVDGFWARRYGQITRLGRILDPFADKIIICGVCTNICVLHTTADARNRDYPVEIPGNCVATFDAQAHQWALAHLEKILGARVV